jgi:hypothetical protein
MDARAGERTRDLLILFIFSFRHFIAEPQRLTFQLRFLWMPGLESEPGIF